MDPILTAAMDEADPPLRLLLVMPGSVNYFYNLYARWMAEGFARLGLAVDLRELPDVPAGGRPGAGGYDLCILSNVAEILHATGDAEGRRRLAALRRAVGTMINFSAECVHTRWFKSNLDLCRELGVDLVLDVGFLPQGGQVDLGGLGYHFVFDGLLNAQAWGPADGPDDDPSARIIPWAHVGGHTPGRVALSDRLVAGFSPRGLIYLPETSPIKEKGSPHLNPEQMERILSRTKYYVWCSHHDHFYLESLRFKTARLAGCLPIKVVDDDEALPADLPFSAWVVREGDLIGHLRGCPFAEARRSFRREYLDHPRLEDGLAGLLGACGHPVPRRASVSSGDVPAGGPAGRCA